MADAEIVLSDEALAAGTSQPIRIKVPSAAKKRKVSYRVTDENSKVVVQDEEFELPEGVDEIAWFVDAPNDASATTLNLQVSVDDKMMTEKSLEVS
jgi:hypothetical protein